MKKYINHIQTLLFYDIPQIFYGEDTIGSKYICLLIKNNGDHLKYICTPISKNRLFDFNKGHIDLRTIYVEPEISEYYFCGIDDFSVGTIELKLYEGISLEEAWLPDPGFFLIDPIETEDDVLDKARELSKPVFSVSLNPPEAQFDMKIHANRLGHFLSVFQNLIKYAYRKACSATDPDFLEAFNLNVIGVKEGSFTIEFDSVESGDLFGSCSIENAFMKVDELTENLDDHEEALKILRKNRGHLANSYIRLLQFIKQNDTSIDYRWAVQYFSESRKRSVHKNVAGPLFDYFSKVDDIRSEAIELEGYLTRADHNNNTWKLYNISDKKEYFGKIKPESGLTVDGFVIRSAIYRFTCEETIEEVFGTGQEKKTIYLLNYDVLDGA